MSYWVNIDKPRKFYRLHLESCPFCTSSETPYKGVNEMKRDGGWFQFESKAEARKNYTENYSDLNWEPCKFCNP